MLLTFGGEKETLHGRESSFFDPLLEYRTPLYSLTDTLSLKGSVGVYLPAAHYTKLDRLEYAPEWRPISSIALRQLQLLPVSQIQVQRLQVQDRR